MKRLTIKEGPLVLIYSIVLYEILAGTFLFALSFLNNYEALIRNVLPIQELRYDIFLAIAFSLFQITLILSVFIRWYFTYYDIKENEIIKTSGLFMKRHKSVPLASITAVEVTQSLFERFIHHGTIVLDHSKNRVTKLRNVEQYEETASLIKSYVYGRNKKAEMDTKTLIAKGENVSVEFKQTLRSDIKKGEASKDLERSVMKTIAGFLNAGGGTLLIGVTDVGMVTGIESDYQTLPKHNRDGFENHMTMLIKNHLGLKLRQYIDIRFESIDGKDICRVDVNPSHKPAYVSDNGKEEFFVRSGNATQPFTMSEAEDYIRNHWR